MERFENMCTIMAMFVISSRGIVVRALTSHQCGQGLISRLCVTCGLSLLVLFSALKFFARYSGFPLSSKKPAFHSK